MFAAVLGLTLSGLLALWAIDRTQHRVERWRPSRSA
jgi:ABC-type nitrate/sulfonate/bicarbonate transport system permease component